MEVSGQLHDAAVLLPRKEHLVLNCTGGWVGQRVSPDVLEKSEIGYPTTGWPAGTLIVIPTEKAQLF